jgi:hypothetical protein
MPLRLGLTTRALILIQCGIASVRLMKNKKDNEQNNWLRYQRRLAKQRAEAERNRYGKIGAASTTKRIDPISGATVGLVTREPVNQPRSSLPWAAKPALRVIGKAGRFGATASSLGKTEADGLAAGAALVARGDAAVTRNNCFILKRWEKAAVATNINWDEDRGQHELRGRKRTVGMIEPRPLPLRPKIKR